MEKKLKLSETLKKLMREKGETLIGLSQNTGVPKSTISEWIAKRNPNSVQVALVAEYLGVSLHYLLFGSEDPKQEITKGIPEDFFSGTFEISIKRVKYTR